MGILKDKEPKIDSLYSSCDYEDTDDGFGFRIIPSGFETMPRDLVFSDSADDKNGLYTILWRSEFTDRNQLSTYDLRFPSKPDKI